MSTARCIFTRPVVVVDLDRLCVCRPSLVNAARSMDLELIPRRSPGVHPFTFSAAVTLDEASRACEDLGRKLRSARMDTYPQFGCSQVE